MLFRFLQTLENQGHADVTSVDSDVVSSIDSACVEADSIAKVTRLLQSWHNEAVLDFPGEPLAFHPQAALWGARLLFRASCLVLYRDIGESDIIRWIRNDEMPDATRADAHFSADLCLRHWADLYRMARARSEDDLLVKVMAELIHTVPLAAPGMHLPINPTHRIFLHEGLSQIFAERALERSDTTCLAIENVHHLVRSKLGAYAAELTRGLLPSENQSHDS